MSAWILTKTGVIEACVNGKTYSVQPDHPMYDECLAFIRSEDYSRFAAIANVEEAMQLLLNFDDPNLKISVKNGKVFYNFNAKDIEINNFLTNNLLDFMRKRLPIRPAILFLENLMQNPSPRAVKELWGFMQHKGLPLTADGCFLGYKRVNSDWLDLNSKTIFNGVGTRVPEMMRNMVDDNWGVACSEGYHVGSLEYVRDFCASEPGSHVIIVKVNPKDVVSVPQEDCSKMRCTVYEVIAEYDQQLKNHLPEVLYDANTLEPVEVGGERLTQIQQAVPAYSWSSGSSDEDDEDDDDDDDYEENEYNDDENDDEDEDDDDNDWDDLEDDEDEEDEESELGVAKAVINWFNDKGISIEYLNSTEVKTAIDEGDPVGILQSLYGAIVENNDDQAKKVLTDRYYRGELLNLLNF